MARKRTDRLDSLELRGFTLRLREALKGESEAAFAKRANISQSGLNRLLRGGMPSLDVLIAIAIAADVSTDWLAFGEEDARRAGTPLNEKLLANIISLMRRIFGPEGSILDDERFGQLAAEKYIEVADAASDDGELAAMLRLVERQLDRERARVDQVRS